MTDTVQAKKCKGFPTGTDCPNAVRSKKLGLCAACEMVRKRAIQRDVERERAGAEAGSRHPAGGVLVTPENPHPHECPLCGQGLTAKHYRETPAAQYDRKTHPLRLKRALAVDKSRASIARRFGITETTLEQWIEQFPEMKAAVDAVEEEDEILYEAAVMKALGPQSQTGEFMGGDPALLKMTLEGRHRIKDRKPPAEEDPRESLEKLAPEARKLLRDLRDIRGDTHPDPKDRDAEEDDDAEK